MFQRPGQHVLVAIGHAVGLQFKPMRHTANAAIVPIQSACRLVVLVDAGVVPDTGEHGVQCEAHKHGDQNGRHNGDAKFMEKLADDAFHEANR